MNLPNNEDQLIDLELEIDGDAKQSLDSAAYWARFISIFIRSVSAFVILLFILVGSSFMKGFKGAFEQIIGLSADFSSGLFIGFMLVMLLLISVIYYFLFNFGKKTKRALVAEDIVELNKGINALKIYFIIMGVIGVLGIITELFSITKLF